MNPCNAHIREKIQADTPIFQGARRSDISMQIRCRMAEKGLKVNDIASRLGVPEAKVSRWLSGNHGLDIDTLYQIADALEDPLHVSVGVMAPPASEDSGEDEQSVERPRN